MLQDSLSLVGIMAANFSTYADPQGEYDDWIEHRNVTRADVWGIVNPTPGAVNP